MPFNLSKQNLILGVIGIVILSYVSYHLINGNRGITAYNQLQKDLSTNREILQELLSEKVALEHKIKLLDNKSMDLDLLEEYARKNLSLSNSKEQIIVPNAK